LITFVVVAAITRCFERHQKGAGKSVKFINLPLERCNCAVAVSRKFCNGKIFMENAFIKLLLLRRRRRWKVNRKGWGLGHVLRRLLIAPTFSCTCEAIWPLKMQHQLLSPGLRPFFRFLWVMNCNAFRSGSPKGQPAKEFTYDSWLSAMKWVKSTFVFARQPVEILCKRVLYLLQIKFNLVKFH